MGVITMRMSIAKAAKSVILCMGFVGLFMGSQVWSSTGNISTTSKYAWSGNVGWINFRPSDGGVNVHENGASSYLSGFAWGENIGWIQMGNSSGSGPNTNTSSTNWGVNMDASGNMSGYAWSETMGWVNFNPTDSPVTMNTSSGVFDQYAWGENFGWLHFKNASTPYGVVADLAAAVPTLSEWGIIVLVLAVAGTVGLRVRRLNLQRC